MLSAVIDEGTGQRLRSVYGLHNEMAGKTGTTQNQVDGWFIGYNPQIVVGIRVGANDVNIHFNTIRLGQGANMAMPIFGRFMKDWRARIIRFGTDSPSLLPYHLSKKKRKYRPSKNI